MSDDITAVAGEARESQQGQDGAKEFTPIQSQDDLNRIVEARLARERAKFADYQELKAAADKLAELEDLDKSELDKAIARAEKAEREAAEAAEALAKKDREVLVQRVAAEMKVPAKWLSGSSEEELVASAEEWLADAQGVASGPAPGVVPSAGTGNGSGSAAMSLEEVRERAKRFAGK